MSNNNQVRPWDLVNPNVPRATKDVAENRYQICKVCPELIKLTSQCKKCGCFMKAKTTIEKAVCPIGKW